MVKSFVIADTHFGHKNIVKFKDSNGEIIRKFDTVKEHDEYLIKQWNSVVGEKDRVYHLGDVVINKKALCTLERLNGRLCLIKGNHDIFKLKDYTKYFDNIRAYKVIPKHGIIMSHIPIHPDCIGRFGLNVHGHLHHNEVMINPHYEYRYFENGTVERIWDHNIYDKRYMCVSMEHLDDYKPMDLQIIINKLNEDS